VNIQRPKLRGQGTWKFLLVFVCIALVFVCGTVQAVHSHSDGNISHADCPLCATAHVGVSIVSQPSLLHFTPTVSYVEANLPPARSHRVLAFALYTRPPPR
jgi:hypothetical protein